MHHLRPALVLIVLFTVLTGMALPLGFSGLATATVPYLANGSLIEHHGVVLGSALLGQDFTQDRYFHPRPSATTDADPKDPSRQIPSPYNASGSNASNYGATSKALVDRVRGNIGRLGLHGDVPADMVTTSASGLDPDISPANAAAQIPRVAAARHLSQDQLRKLVASHTQPRLFGFIGEARVNVLELNMALDGEARRGFGVAARAAREQTP